MTTPKINPSNHFLANVFVENIENQIVEFTNELKADEAFAVYVLLNDGSRIFASWFGYHNPHLVIIEGTNDKKQEVKLLLHMNEVQIILIKDKKDNFKDRQKIGFQQKEDTSSEEIK